MKKLKNLLELANRSRNTCKFANKLMADTSGEINLQSKRDIIYRLTKVKSAASAHYKANVLSFFSVRNIPFESNASIKPKKCILQTIKKNNILNIFRVLMCQ